LTIIYILFTSFGAFLQKPGLSLFKKFYFIIPIALLGLLKGENINFTKLMLASISVLLSFALNIFYGIITTIIFFLKLVSLNIKNLYLEVIIEGIVLFLLFIGGSIVVMENEFYIKGHILTTGFMIMFFSMFYNMKRYFGINWYSYPFLFLSFLTPLLLFNSYFDIVIVILISLSITIVSIVKRGSLYVEYIGIVLLLFYYFIRLLTIIPQGLKWIQMAPNF